MIVRRFCLCASAGMLLLAAAASAQTAPAAAPAPTPERPISQIPAAKLATLRQLADISLNAARFRSNIVAHLDQIDQQIAANLQKQGLTPARAQDFVAAFNPVFTQRLDAALNNDALVQLLDAAYTDDQAAQLLAFYKTPLGQHFAEVEPGILAKGAGQMQSALVAASQNAAHDVSGSFAELNKDTAPPPSGELPRPTAVETSLYPPVAQAPADLAAAEKRAAANGHRVLVIFGANWCYDCHVLDTALHSPAYAPLIAGYEVVSVNVGDMGQDNLDLARKLGVDISKGVPALAVLDANGAVLVAQKQGEFQDTRSLQGSALTTFLQTWQKH